MPGRSRHGLHAVPDGLTPDGDAPDGGAPDGGAPTLDPPAVGASPSRQDGRARSFLSLEQRSVVLGIGGRLDADTAGRLRLLLTMFTISGGPTELVLDLSGVIAVDEDGMAPVHEADEAMTLRRGTLRLAAVSPAVAAYLGDVRCGRTPAGLPRQERHDD